ncbi:MAG: sensor histidine kinase [Clostridia bacterium]|nr:sensor histidine kinase [Clostridia bacterium]
MLFVSVLSASLEVTLTEENLQMAAKLTFLNVVLISTLFTLVDVVRRKLTTEKVTRHITTAAREIVKGDFDVRIAPISHFSADENYNVIIDCFNTMASELASVETLRTDFIANVSHEMKTPLTVMQNYGRLLQTPDLSEEKRVEYAKAITDASRRLSDMMTNILKLNRLENQQIYPRAEVYDLGEQLCESLLQFEDVWEARGIEIDTALEEQILVSADRELLLLVWNNLFSNAFKFTEQGGRVRLSLAAEGEYAVVRVEDTGCGMSPEVGAHIFEKFYQGDTSHASQGNGLGLALVKRVVDILQGEIGVESTVGVGTAFTVRIRRVENALEEAR